MLISFLALYSTVYVYQSSSVMQQIIFFSFHLEIRYSSEHVDDALCEVKEFYEIKEILINFIILYGL
jgi:hypothetical protein